MVAEARTVRQNDNAEEKASVKKTELLRTLLVRSLIALVVLVLLSPVIAPLIGKLRGPLPITDVVTPVQEELAAIPEQDAAIHVYQEVWAPLAESLTNEEKVLLTEAPWNSGELEDLRALLGRLDPALDAAAEATHRPRLGGEFTADSLGPTTPTFELMAYQYGYEMRRHSLLRTLVRALSARAYLRLIDGDVSGWAADLEAVSRLARHAAGRPATTISFLIRAGAEQAVHDRIIQALGVLPDRFTANDLDRIAAMLPTDTMESFAESVAFEASRDRDLIARWPRGWVEGLLGPNPSPPLVSYLTLSIHAVYPARDLAAWNETQHDMLLEFARGTPAEALGKLPNVPPAPRGVSLRVDDFAKVPIMHLASVLWQLRLERSRIEFVIGMHRFRLANGRFPESADEYESAGLGPVPIDPLTVEPAIWLSSVNGPLVYFRGIDGDDDMGRHTPSCGSWSDDPEDPEFDGDWVLFPPQPADWTTP